MCYKTQLRSDEWNMKATGLLLKHEDIITCRLQHSPPRQDLSDKHSFMEKLKKGWIHDGKKGVGSECTECWDFKRLLELPPCCWPAGVPLLSSLKLRP